MLRYTHSFTRKHTYTYFIKTRICLYDLNIDYYYSPLLRPGYLSPGITIEEVKFEKHHNNTQVYNTVTTVKAETRGQKKVCLQIYNEQR